MRKLTEVEPGQSTIIKMVLSKGYTKERMLALGFTQDTLIKVVRRGPQDNLTIYEIRGTRIALRKEESDKILVTD